MKENWYVFGISHQKADYALRGHFSLSAEDILRYYRSVFPISGCQGFILSTCNRTAFFLNGRHPKFIEQQFRSEKGIEAYDSVTYRHEGKAALAHFFEVAAGLDSQIIGDFEIIGQLKRAAILAKQMGVLGGETERLTNSATYCSRRIKNETGLSNGSSSVSYACVRMMKDKLNDFGSARILIIGLGEMGNHVLENSLKHKEAPGIWVSNRSDEKALMAVKKFGVNHVDFQHIGTMAPEFDAIVNASAAPYPLLSEKEIQANQRTKLFLDLAMPAALPADTQHHRVFQVDEISASIATDLKKRTQEIPRAKRIVQEELNEFIRWQRARKVSPAIQVLGLALTKKLGDHPKSENLQFRRKRLEARLFQSVKNEQIAPELILRWASQNTLCYED